MFYILGRVVLDMVFGRIVSYTCRWLTLTGAFYKHIIILYQRSQSYPTLETCELSIQ